MAVGICDVELTTTWTTRSPQNSTRMAPAAVRNVTPFESLWDSLTAKRDSLAAHAVLARMMSGTINFLVAFTSPNGIRSSLCVEILTMLSLSQKCVGNVSIQSRGRFPLVAWQRPPWSALLAASEPILQRPVWLNRGPRSSDKGAQSDSEDDHPCRLGGPVSVLRWPVACGWSRHTPGRAMRAHEEPVPAWSL